MFDPPCPRKAPPTAKHRPLRKNHEVCCDAMIWGCVKTCMMYKPTVVPRCLMFSNDFWWNIRYYSNKSVVHNYETSSDTWWLSFIDDEAQKGTGIASRPWAEQRKQVQIEVDPSDGSKRTKNVGQHWLAHFLLGLRNREKQQYLRSLPFINLGLLISELTWTLF